MSLPTDLNTFLHRQTLDEFSEIQKLSREVPSLPPSLSPSLHPSIPLSLPPVSKFFSFLFAQECKKAKSEKLTEILKSIENAAQEVLLPLFAFYIAPHFRMTWISTLRQRNRRFQRSPARILIIRPSLMQFLLPNLMIKVGYPTKKNPHPLMNIIHGLGLLDYF